MTRQIITIDPRKITHLSRVSGCGKTRFRRIAEFGFVFDGLTLRLSGDWDGTKRLIIEMACYNDYQMFKSGLPYTYNWTCLYNSMQVAYIQDPAARYVEIGIGRTGNMLLVDGRHRLIVAQDLGIMIPVEVVLLHRNYRGNEYDDKG